MGDQRGRENRIEPFHFDLHFPAKCIRLWMGSCFGTVTLLVDELQSTNATRGNCLAPFIRRPMDGNDLIIIDQRFGVVFGDK